MALLDNAFYISSVAYDALTKWYDHTEVAGHVIQPFTAQAASNERAYVCIVGGATGATEPATWTNTRGAKVTSSTAVYQECSGVAALNGDLTNTPTWSTLTGDAAFAVTLGQVIKRNNGASIWICSTAGTSGTSEPAWADDNAGTTRTDGAGALVWTCLGASFGVLAAPHRSLNAATLATWGQAGNSFLLADNHAQAYAASQTITVPGTITNPSKVISFDHLVGAVPPTASLSGASISCGASGGFLTVTGFADFDGLTFTAGVSGAATLTVASTAAMAQIFRNCTFNLRSSSAISFMIGSASQQNKVRFYNCNFNTSGNIGSYINPYSTDIIWRGGAFTYTTNKPTNMIQVSAGPNAFNAVFEGVDLSGMDTNLFNDNVQLLGKLLFKDCKLHASTVIMNGYPSNYAMLGVDMIRSDSENTVHKMTSRGYAGDLTTDTATVRTGGATDGTTAHSWKVVTTSNAGWLAIFELPSIIIWNNVVAGTIDVTLYGAGSATPTNAQLWFDCVYLGDSLFPLATYASCGLSSRVESPASWDTDGSSTWSGSPTNKFSKTLTISPRQKGYIYIYPKMAVATTTLYLDPKPVLS